MKTALDKLFSLLGRCSENTDETAKLQLIARITQSQDYKELRRAAAFQTPFLEYYSFSALDGLDIAALQQREQLLHKLVSFHSQLIQCINSGNGPEFTSGDLPDFTSSKSISRLLNKISLAHKNTNYTNISEENALLLFSDSTVRSAQACFDRLPVSLTRRKTISAEDIKNCMGDTLYCIPIDDFVEAHQRFLAFAMKSERTVQKEQTRRKKHALSKIAIILLCFGAVFSFSQFGFFQGSFTQTLYGVILIASIPFLIWG